MEDTVCGALSIVVSHWMHLKKILSRGSAVIGSTKIICEQIGNWNEDACIIIKHLKIQLFITVHRLQAIVATCMSYHFESRIKYAINFPCGSSDDKNII